MSSDSLRFLGLPSSPVDYTCPLLDKHQSAFNYIQYMFDRTNTMFRYSGLPDTIPEPMLEYMLQIYGSVGIIEHKGDIYAIRGEFGGAPDPYYRPTMFVAANPALGLESNYRVVTHLPPYDKETWLKMPPCVRFLNDSQILGLLPLFSRYAWQMTENDISIRCAQINIRSQHIIVADTGPEIESASQFMKNLEDGHLSAIMKTKFAEGVSITNVATGQSNMVMQLIELQQYLKASWYNEIGLNSNFNMKSQYISSEEINSSADIMLPLIDNMFEQRQQAVEAINQWFGTSISVEKDSAWEKKQIQADLGVQLDPISGDPLPGSSVDGTEQQETNRQIQDDDSGTIITTAEEIKELIDDMTLSSEEEKAEKDSEQEEDEDNEGDKEDKDGDD